MKKNLLTLSILSGVAVAGSATSIGISASNEIEETVVNENGELVIRHNNGKEENLGIITGKQGEAGPKGENGAAVKNAYFDDEGNLILVLSNGDTINVGKSSSSHFHDLEYNIVQPTCSSSGSIVVSCKTCDYVNTTEIAPLEHTYTPWVETTKTTCSSDGEKVRFCSLCGYKQVETITMHDHIISEHYLFDSGSHWHYCQECGIKLDEHNHDEVEGKCSICNYVFPYNTSIISDGYIYDLRDDGQGYVLIAIPNDATDIVVPEKFNGLAVTGVKSIFQKNKKIKTVSIHCPLSYIEDSLFNGCSSLESVTLPNTIEYIGSSAFSDCKSLKSIVIPESVKNIKESAFHSCSSLQSIVIPDSVTKIGDACFNYCSSLSNVVLSNSLESVGDFAFDNTALTTIIIPKTLTYFGSKAFNSKIEKVFFEDALFWNDMSNAISEKVLSDPELAATLLKYSGVWYKTPLIYTLNDDEASYSVKMLNPSHCRYFSITIPDTYNNLPVTSIYNYAFNDCKYVSSILLPNTIKTIGELAFANSGLKTMELPNSLEKIGSEAFGYCEALESITIPDSLTQISPSLFTDCVSLETIVLPNSITYIGNNAFSGCLSLNSINIPNSVKYIDNSVFLNCESLISIVIPSSVEQLGWNVFKNCFELTIYCEAEKQPSGWQADWNSSNCKVIWGYNNTTH